MVIRFLCLTVVRDVDINLLLNQFVDREGGNIDTDTECAFGSPVLKLCEVNAIFIDADHPAVKEFMSELVGGEFAIALALDSEPPTKNAVGMHFLESVLMSHKESLLIILLDDGAALAIPYSDIAEVNAD